MSLRFWSSNNEYQSIAFTDFCCASSSIPFNNPDENHTEIFWFYMNNIETRASLRLAYESGFSVDRLRSALMLLLKFIIKFYSIPRFHICKCTHHMPHMYICIWYVCAYGNAINIILVFIDDYLI